MATLKQRAPRRRDRRYLGAIARLPSLISGKEPVEVCHLRYGEPDRGKPPTGMGEKPDDKWTLPLTPEEHRLGVRAQHAGNEREWWASHGIDPVAVCEVLYRTWSEKPWDDAEVRIARMRQIVMHARMGMRV
jgi:hypothetical protein